jgi:hypothetical protein
MTRLTTRVGAAIAVVGLVYASASPSASGADTVAFEGVASSYGVDFTLANPSIPIGLVIQGAGPVAQAALSPIVADGFASVPYPGDVVANLPPAIGALLLNGFQVPPYPFYTASSLASPRTTANFPGITLTSDSSTTRTSSSAVAGTPGLGWESRADVRGNDDGSGVATANTKAAVVSVGGLVDISGINSSATVELSSSGVLKRSSSLSIGRISVPGLNVRIPESTPSAVPIPVPIPGLPQIGSIPFPSIPLPLGGTVIEAPDIGFVDGTFTIGLPGLGPAQRFAIPAQPVLDAFKALGLNITYQPASETPTGIIAASLLVSTVLPSPPANEFFNGPTQINFAIGRASASIAGGASDTPVDLGTGSGDIGSGSVDLPTSLDGSSPTFGSPGMPSLTPTIGRSRAVSPGATQAVSSIDLGSAESFYLVFVGLGLVAVLGGQVLRLLGVRT